VHPFQVPDEDEMLDNIESGHWTWKGNNWVNVSEEAKNLIMSMMCPDPEKRFTAQQCLESKWIVRKQFLFVHVCASPGAFRI
jgi:calcium-dependent protein kinase